MNHDDKSPPLSLLLLLRLKSESDYFLKIGNERNVFSVILIGGQQVSTGNKKQKY